MHQESDKPTGGSPRFAKGLPVSVSTYPRIDQRQQRISRYAQSSGLSAKSKRINKAGM